MELNINDDLMTYDEIVELALRYIEEDDIIEFPMEGELFFFLIRDNDKQNTTPHFGGYGIALGYVLNKKSKPAGKWINFHYLDLKTFPPSMETIKLQPPHIAKGEYQTPDRTKTINIIRMETDYYTILEDIREYELKHKQQSKTKDNSKQKSDNKKPDNIIEFKPRGNNGKNQK